MKRRHGKVYSGHTIPYGSLVDTSPELRAAYYRHGYKDDDSLPELPVLFPEEVCTCPEEALFKKELATQVSYLLDNLSPRPSKVLRLRFGIGMNNDAEYTLEEIGRIFDLTRERIRQIEHKAFRSLKNIDKKTRELYDPQEYYETSDKKKIINKTKEKK